MARACKLVELLVTMGLVKCACGDVLRLPRKSFSGAGPRRVEDALLDLYNEHRRKR